MRQRSVDHIRLTDECQWLDLTLCAMRHAIVASLLLLTTHTSAQSWCAPGARWHHTYSNPSIGDLGYSVTEYLGDVLFQDSVCQQFAVTDHLYSLQTQTSFVEGPFAWYTTSTADIVYLWTGLAFDTLFRWDAVPGDRWYVPDAWKDEHSIIEVTDTGHVALAGMNRRWLAAGTYVDGSPGPDTLVEGIGPMKAYWTSSVRSCSMEAEQVCVVTRMT